MTTVVALDLSLTSTGVCAWDEAGPSCHTIRPKASLPMHERLGAIHASITGFVDAFDPDLVVIEKLFARFITATAQLARVHGVATIAVGDRLTLEVEPAGVKKWATGNGGADKDAIRAALDADHPGNGARNDDERDAHVLAQIGRAYLDAQPTTPQQQGLLATATKVTHRPMATTRKSTP